MRRLFAGALAAAALASPALAREALTAPEIRAYPAREANQGVAVDARHFYVIDNSEIGKYEKASGERVAAWSGDAERFPHLNACLVVKAELICASSNYPKTQMVSSVEVFDARALVPRRSIPLPAGVGSLTWVDRRGGHWWALFANYDGRGGEAGRDHRQTTLVEFDDRWRRLRSFSFPDAVLARFAPRSSSGGGFGDDGLLYVTGHDEPELYVLRVPRKGAVLEHVASIKVPMEGQAIAWDKSQRRTLYGIRRDAREVTVARVPPVSRVSKIRSH